MKRNRLLTTLGIALAGAMLLIGFYFLPPVHARLGWRVANLRTQLHYLFNPPGRVELAPQTDGAQATRAVATLQYLVTQALAPSLTPIPAATLEATLPAATPAWTPTPLPGKAILTGFRYEYQTFNNCGPANLAMLLSFWKWAGTQATTKAALRPNDDDANVMPGEMLDFIRQQPGLDAELRVNGSLDRLRRLLAAGFPVVIESGHQPEKDWWMGHYVLVSGYDDASGAFITQDSLIMPDLPLPYEDLEAHWWRDFNRLYLVAFPAEQRAEVLRLLGEDADPQENLRRALRASVAESAALTGRDQFFALFNQGELALALGDVPGAAASFDAARGVYDTLAEDDRPWRVFWYRTAMYEAYYRAGRYQDVIDVVDSVLSMLSKRGLEESHYWRGLAYEALGKRDDAIFDYQIALRLRPTYTLAAEGLQRLGGAAAP